MHHYRQVLARLRQGDSYRDIARSRLMGRPKVAAFRTLALTQGWLEPAAVLPDDAALGAAAPFADRWRGPARPEPRGSVPPTAHWRLRRR